MRGETQVKTQINTQARMRGKMQVKIQVQKPAEITLFLEHSILASRDEADLCGRGRVPSIVGVAEHHYNPPPTPPPCYLVIGLADIALPLFIACRTGFIGRKKLWIFDFLFLFLVSQPVRLFVYVSLFISLSVYPLSLSLTYVNIILNSFYVPACLSSCLPHSSFPSDMYT